MPRITCCIPVYNCEAYIEAAVRSILQQTLADFTLLIANDGSTDESMSIVRRLHAADRRIRIIDRPDNRGLVYTRNELLDAVDTEFIALMDADDICVPDRFAKQVAFLDAHPEHVCVGGQVMLIDPDGAPLDRVSLPLDHAEIDDRLINGGFAPLCNPTVMMRTAAVRAAGGYREGFQPAEDYDLFLRLADIGKLANLPDDLTLYRRHIACAGYAKSQQQQSAMRKACLEGRQRRNLPPIEPLIKVDNHEITPWHAYRQWAIWAFRGGHFQAARKNALRALKHRPLAPRSWYTLAVAVMGLDPFRRYR